jgi:hypothetical protein
MVSTLPVGAGTVHQRSSCTQGGGKGVRVGTSAFKLLHTAEAASKLIRGRSPICRGWYFMLHNVEAIGQSPKTWFLFIMNGFRVDDSVVSVQVFFKTIFAIITRFKGTSIKK